MPDLMRAAEAAYNQYLLYYDCLNRDYEWKDLSHTRKMIWFEIAEAAVKSFHEEVPPCV